MALPATPIFHPLTRREACVSCHSQPRLGAVALPANHANLLQKQCLSCHERAAGPTAAVYGGGLVAGLIFAIGVAWLARRLRRGTADA